MNTLETDIEISTDGSVRLLSPMPDWLRPGRNHVLLVMAENGAGRRAASVLVAAHGIEKTAHVCGGDACIASTRIPVWTLEQSRRLGMTEAQLLEAYPSLRRNELTFAWD